MAFDEANTVEAMVLERMTKPGWTYIHGPSLERSISDVLLESVLAGALVRLNPDIAAQPERADEVIYKLRAVISGVLGGGLVGANEEFMSWVRGERSMPFGPNNEHVTSKLRRHEQLGNPAVVIVADRIDLDTQISGTFNAADVSNLVTADSGQELHNLLARDARKVIITTIHKFAEADGVLNERDNIIVLVDEAHRTHEVDLGRQMRTAMPKCLQWFEGVDRSDFS